jgi:hypothetical protein
MTGYWFANLGVRLLVALLWARWQARRLASWLRRLRNRIGMVWA